MLYIDKLIHKVTGDKVTEDYLNNCCFDTATNRYINICYDKRDGIGKNFSSVNAGIYKSRMINILYKSQYGYCCYCLRKLRKKTLNCNIDKISIEHIIPRGYNNNNNGNLTAYQTAPNLGLNEIILREVFENKDNQIFPPFPHNVAYNNLVLSCLGTFPNSNNSNSPMCCNIIRREKYAFPAYYLKNIQQYICYETDGGIIVDQSAPLFEDIRKLVCATRLFIRPLKDIRRLWYELRHTSYRDIYNCNSAYERHILLAREVTSMTLDDKKKFFSKFIKDDYWNTFMLYHKFYSIMKRLHP